MRNYKSLAIIVFAISIIVMLLPIFAYVATFLWYWPGAIIIALLSLVLLYLFIKTKDTLYIALFIANLIVLLVFSAPLLLA